MKRLTKKMALRLTAELWEWIGAEPRRIKREWPGWEEQEGGVFANCFLCHWLKAKLGRSCRKSCVLKSCLSGSSPYGEFEDALIAENYPAAQQAAALIAKLCRDELARLEKK